MKRIQIPALKVVDIRNKQNVYFVGDIHGRYTELMDCLSDVGFNRHTDLLVSTGDLIDKGPESPKAISLIFQSWFLASIGNHELMFIANNKSEPNGKVSRSQRDSIWAKKLPVPLRGEFANSLGKLPCMLEIQTNHGLVGITHAVPPHIWSKTAALYSAPTPKISITTIAIDDPFDLAWDEYKNLASRLSQEPFDLAWGECNNLTSRLSQDPSIRFTVHGHYHLKAALSAENNHVWLDTSQEQGGLRLHHIDEMLHATSY